MFTITYGEVPGSVATHVSDTADEHRVMLRLSGVPADYWPTGYFRNADGMPLAFTPTHI